MSFLHKLATSAETLFLRSKKTLGVPLSIPKEKVLYDFRYEHDLSNWVVSTDRSIGGMSQSQWSHLCRTNQSTEKLEENASVDNLPCAVFSGRLSMACEPTEAGIVRSGYCAVRAPKPKGVQLFGYQGLQMRVKTDGRIFRVNIQTEGWNPFDIHMGFIKAPAGKWVDIELPFSALLLTSRGYVKLDDATVLDPSKLLNIGFAISDQEEGPFELRVQWIKALAELDHASDEREKISLDDLGEDKPSLSQNRSNAINHSQIVRRLIFGGFNL